MSNLLALAVCAFEVSRITAYNVDTSSYRVLKGPQDDSYFGYSVASARINGSLTLWSGSPKYSVSDSAVGGGREGGIFHCEFEPSESTFLQQSCKRMQLKATPPHRNGNVTSGKNSHDSEFSEDALPKCSFEDGICNYTIDKPEFWVSGTGYQRLTRRKYNTKVTADCYPSIKKGKRLTGPPEFTVHEGMTVLDSDKAVAGRQFKENVRTKLVTQRIDAKAGKTQCFRFCFNAFSLLDFNENDVSIRREDWYRNSGGKRRDPKPERSLRVYLQYEGEEIQRLLFYYRGPRDVASKYWNFTEMEINHDKDGSYKIYFEVTIVNTKERKKCSAVSDLALTDITVTNSNCHDESTHIDTLESEQSIGMNLDVSIVDGNTRTLTACGPLWQQNCGFAKEATGVCYEVRSNSSQPKIIKNPELKGCIRGKIDIVLLVDQSGSVNQCNFQKVKHWLRSVVRGFAIGPNEQDLGIVIYSSAELTKDVFDLGFEKYGNSGMEKKQRMLEGLHKLPYEAGKTYTGVAFKHANDMLWGPKARKNAKKMIILLTDGVTSTPDRYNLQTQSNISRTRDATILAVGVAEYNEAELIGISGDKSNFFSAKDFSELEKVRETLRLTVSHTNLEGSRRSKSMQNCQMGFSIHRGKDGLLMGAPGCFNRAGDVMRSASSEQAEEKVMADWNETAKNTSSNASMVHDMRQNTRYLKPTLVVPTLDNLEEAMHGVLVESYFGYSVTSGNFFGTSAGVFVASSAPRYNGTGAVLVYKSTRSNPVSDSKVLHGVQLGEYFGAVVCAEDINNDSFTDLFVGAPLHSDVNPDEGRVYVYMGGKRLSDKPNVILKGSGNAFSRFGLVISRVGDISLDGYKDLVVSAPQEENNRGVIYIFCGGEGNIASEFTQRIAASLFEGENELKLFGQSVSGGLDVDGNKYPDILVGTPGSDAVVVLRTHPVARIGVQFYIESPEIDRRNRMCWLRNTSAEEACIRYKLCFAYSGLSVQPGIRLSYNIHADIFQSISRIAFKESVDNRKTMNGISSLWFPNVPVCAGNTLYLKKNILDMMTNLTLKMTYAMEEQISNKTAISAEEMSPVLDARQTRTHYATTFFKTYCEDTSSCVANISITGSGPVSDDGQPTQSYVLTHKRLLRFRVELFNDGPEEAHAVLVTFRYPTSLVFSSLAETKCFRTLSTSEEITGVEGVNSISIVLSRTLLDVKETCLGFINFLAKSVLIEKQLTFVELFVNASTVSEDFNLKNNVKTYRVGIEYQTSFRIYGRSFPEEIFGYITNATNTSSFSHKYTIVNNGPFAIKNMSLSVQWPTCTKGQGDIHYTRYIKTTFWRGTLAETNESDLAHVDDDMLRQKDSSVCEDESYSGNNETQERQEVRCRQMVEICPSISIFIADVHSHQQINLKLVGEIELSQFGSIEDPVLVSSSISVNVISKTRLKYSDDQEFQDSVTTTVHPPQKFYKVDEAKDITNLPIWAYIISILVGLLLLIASTCLLRVCGFFESKYAMKKKVAEEGRVDGVQESTPMNPSTQDL